MIIEMVFKMTKDRMYIYAFVLCMSIMIVHDSFAQMPSFDRLSPVNDTVNAPSNVALDQYENIYVVESVNNRLLVFSQGGVLLNTLTNLQKPMCSGVDNSGNVYICNKNTGNVSVYNSELNFLFKLGAGDGEFMQPNDIAIDSSGLIYVVDHDAHTVKVYNPDGTFNGLIGTHGNGNGQLHKPSSIVIDESAAEVIVLDNQQIFDRSSGYLDGARVQKFNMDGTYKSSFSSYGNQVGQMFRPQHVEIDNEGRIYVTDTYHNVVLVYDSGGLYLGALYDLENPLRTPVGIARGMSNRIYIASLTSKKVERYGISLFTDMVVTGELTFEAYLNEENPQSQNIGVTNNGTTDLNWTAGTAQQWISLSELSGTTGPGGTSTMQVSVDISGLSEGSHSGTISVAASSGAVETVSVELNIIYDPLTADPGGPYNVYEGQSIIMDGAASIGQVVLYEWDIYNDGSYEYSSSSPVQSHMYAVQGEYTAGLRVTNSRGVTDHASVTVSVLDSLPTASFSASATMGSNPFQVEFINLSSGFDQPLTYEWDFDSDENTDSFEESPAYSFSEGTHSITLKVTDSDGSTSELTKTDYITTEGNCSALPVRSGGIYYDNLQDAYDAAVTGQVIMSRATSISGDLHLNRNISVTLTGGYNCDYSLNGGRTVLNGSIEADTGSISVENYSIEP